MLLIFLIQDVPYGQIQKIKTSTNFGFFGFRKIFEQTIRLHGHLRIEHDIDSQLGDIEYKTLKT